MSDRARNASARPRSEQRRHQAASPQGTRTGSGVPSQRSARSQAGGRTKPVRRTVDLPPAYHVRLTEWCAEAAEEIGATRVTGQDVMRALVARLLVDEKLSRRIRADLSMYV